MRTTASYTVPMTLPFETSRVPWIPMASVVAMEEPPIVPVTVVELEPPPPSLDEPHAMRATREETGNQDEFIESLLFGQGVAGRTRRRPTTSSLPTTGHHPTLRSRSCPASSSEPARL